MKSAIKIFGLIIMVLCLSCGWAEATVIFGDHFDSQPDWNMSQSVSLLSGWTGKLGANRGGSYEVGYINSIGRHGTTGKGFVQYWDKTVELGLAQDSWLMKQNLNIPSEFYLGYWFQHDPNWNWGGVSSLKLLKIHFNNGTTWDIYWTNFCAGCPSWASPTGTGFSYCTDEYGRNWLGSWNALGNDWHYFIWHVQHSTGLLELFVDGISEAETNYTTAFVGTGFDSGYGISFGGNITDGKAGVNEMWTKYDDVVIATTKADVEDFLGVTAAPLDTMPPTPPSGLSVS